MKRLICLLVGHRWSEWYQGGYLISVEQFRAHEGDENRICWRCGRDEFQQPPASVASRPDGFHLERVPVHEADPAEAGQPLAVVEYDGTLPRLDGDPDRLDEQFAAMRQIIGSLGIQLETVKTDREDVARLARERADTIRAMHDQLAMARRVLKSYGADLALLHTLNPPDAAVQLAARWPTGV